VQPFAYLQLVFATLIGVTVFNEVLEPHVVLGAAVVVGAGLFTLWRERMRSLRNAA
jgi:drug/metabolite transporter (DMT)-like permease